MSDTNDKRKNELMDIEDEFEAEVREELRQRYERRLQERADKKDKTSGKNTKLKKKD